MAISSAAKVGLVTLGGLLIVGAGFVWLTNFSLTRKGYDFQVIYQDVAGLMPGANVMLMGVKVGKVQDIGPEERKVFVKVHIFDSNTHILSSSRFMIMSQGIVGEKSLEIFPLQKQPEAVSYVQGGDRMRGDDPQRLEFVMEDLTNTFNEFKRSTDPKKLNEIFNKTAQNLLDTSETVKNLGHQAGGVLGDVGTTVQHVNALIDTTDRLVGSASPAEIQGTVHDLHALSTGLLQTYHNFFGTSKEQKANAATLRNLRSLAEQLDKLATTLNETAGNPEVQTDVKQLIKNIRNLTGSVSQATTIAQSPVSSIAGLKVSPRLQGVAAHTPTGTGLAGNLGLHVNLGANYAEAGLEQIGEGNYLNLAFGNEQAWGPLGYKFGLIRSKIGVGIDYDLTRDLRLTGQVYDPFHPTFRLGTTYFPLTGGQYGLLAEWARPFDLNENLFWLGVEWRPLQ